MTDIENFQRAQHLFQEAHFNEALRVFKEVYAKTGSIALKIESLLAIVLLLDSVDQNKDLLNACDEGLYFSRIAKNNKAQAYFLAKKAMCYLIQSTTLLSIKKDITLAPKRINFSLESDRDLYESVSKDYDTLTKQADELFTFAFQLVQKDDYDALAHLYCLEGEKLSSASMHYLIEHMRRAKLFTYIKWLGFKAQHVLSFKEQREFRNLSNSSVQAYLRSVRCYEKNNDDIGISCAYHDLSNHLQGIGSYRRARYYLILSKKNSSAKQLIPQRLRLQKSIDEKNKNLPDHKSKLPRPVLRRDVVATLKRKLSDWFAKT